MGGTKEIREKLLILLEEVNREHTKCKFLILDAIDQKNIDEQSYGDILVYLYNIEKVLSAYGKYKEL